jgi:hypothetical protein
MKYFIGGLFKNQDSAVLARNALRENGFDTTSINMLESTHEKMAVVQKNKPSIQQIGIAALIGGFIGAAIGGTLGLLVGLGMLHVPGFYTSVPGQPFQFTPDFMFTSLVTGLMFGVVTGVILGVASRLLMTKYRKVNTSKGIDQGDFMLAVEADDIRKETKARLTMKEYGAIKFEEFREKWDTEIWSVYKDEAPQTH